MWMHVDICGYMWIHVDTCENTLTYSCNLPIQLEAAKIIRARLFYVHGCVLTGKTALAETNIFFSQYVLFTRSWLRWRKRWGWWRWWRNAGTCVACCWLYSWCHFTYRSPCKKRVFVWRSRSCTSNVGCILYVLRTRRMRRKRRI